MGSWRRCRSSTFRSIPFVAALFAALVFGSPAHGQKSKVYRVAYFTQLSPLVELKDPGGPEHPRAFVARLRELGYAEGRNLILDFYSMEGRRERIPAIWADIVRSKADAVYSTSQFLVEGHIRDTAGIPIVTAAAWSIVNTGLAKSLARPGGTVTGYIMDVDEGTEAKRLQLLLEAIPRVKRVAYLGTPGWWESPSGRRVRDTAQHLGLSLAHASYTGTDISAAATVIERQAPDAIFVPSGSASFTNRKRIGELALAKRLPCIAAFKENVESGCLMSYGADIDELLPIAADYVAKILEGAKPGDLPIQHPTKFELVVSMKSARVLGITIPQPILLRANRVIE